MLYYIQGLNVPSSKNSKRICNGRLIGSKLSLSYKPFIDSKLLELKDLFISESSKFSNPLYIGFYFFRDSRRRWDFNNISQTIADSFVRCGLIKDDDTKHFIPVYLGEELSSKENSGFYFKIINTI